MQVYIDYVSDQTNLSTSVHLVGEFDFTEGDGLLHPVWSEVGRVRVHVDSIVGGGFSLAARHPVTVDVFPAMSVDGPEVEHERVHGAGDEPGHGHLQHRKHPSATNKQIESGHLWFLRKVCKEHNRGVSTWPVLQSYVRNTTAQTESQNRTWLVFWLKLDEIRMSTFKICFCSRAKLLQYIVQSTLFLIFSVALKVFNPRFCWDQDQVPRKVGYKQKRQDNFFGAYWEVNYIQIGVFFARGWTHCWIDQTNQ